ncbi:MAG: hypothetical protein Q8O92_04810 [Candidatus Latescibacter sp.]|nr:hypothetical protein [Candidatus Latescibacter sp.]
MQTGKTAIPSTFDGAEQRMMYCEASGKSRPLLVALHTWSYDYTQETSAEYFKRAVSRDWHCIFPDFRGPNRTPLSTPSGGRTSFPWTSTLASMMATAASLGAPARFRSDTAYGHTMSWSKPPGEQSISSPNV